MKIYVVSLHGEDGEYLEGAWSNLHDAQHGADVLEWEKLLTKPGRPGMWFGRINETDFEIIREVELVPFAQGAHEGRQDRADTPLPFPDV